MTLQLYLVESRANISHTVWASVITILELVIRAFAAFANFGVKPL